MNAGPAERALLQGMLRQFPEEAALTLDRLEPSEVVALLEVTGESAPRVFDHLRPDLAADVSALMDGDLFVRIFSELDPARAAALMGRLDADTRGERLRLLPASLVREIELLVTYPVESAGGIMDPRVVPFRSGESVGAALDRIRSLQRPITDLCVVDTRGRLEGVVPLQVVAVSAPDRTLGQLATGPPVSIPATSPREEVLDLFEARKLLSLPVVSFDGRLLGIIRYDALMEAARDNATESLQAMAGAGREERALSPPWLAIRKRLPWLQVNLGTAFLAAAVVGLFEDTIARFTMLAIFLPVVAGQSGNTGAQALAVTMRGLALREINTRHWLRVAGKEVIAGVVNGLAVAATTAAAAYFWTGSPGIPLVIGVSMVFSMGMAGLAGATIPVVLTTLRQDPAQSASIILTTVTDVVGFMSFLGLATVLSSQFGLNL